LEESLPFVTPPATPPLVPLVAPREIVGDISERNIVVGSRYPCAYVMHSSSTVPNHYHQERLS
jgi:hypothetical protein